MANNTKKRIEELISKTFNAIQDAYNYQTENAPKIDHPNRIGLSRIVFPKNRKMPIRISEQELRFVFVEQLIKTIDEGWNVYYSAETPTKDGYKEFKNKKGGQPRQDKDGRSGVFDLVIFNDKLQRIALIEFKANNASKHEHKKDFVKLNNPKEGDENVLRYFIEIIKSYDNDTLSSLQGKIEENEPIFRCWSLEDGKDITEEIRKVPKK